MRNIVMVVKSEITQTLYLCQPYDDEGTQQGLAEEQDCD